MNLLDVWVGERRAGVLSHDPSTNLFAFTKDDAWDVVRDGVALNAAIAAPAPPAVHSKSVRNFFENLLPEGQALDDAARAMKTSRSNLVGLLAALGQDMPGAIRIGPPGADLVAVSAAAMQRTITPEELSLRIRERPHQPFLIWDQKVRLSIAGFQDKLAVLMQDDNMAFADGPGWASTHILKPEPVSEAFAGMTSNEFFCMRLAKAVGLPVAEVRLLHVPEPVLCVTRFDRRLRADGVTRQHVIDGCQLLDLSRDEKYERAHGVASDGVYLPGASLAMLFAQSDQAEVPLAWRDALMRWTIFQVLIGNTDAHAKNLSFFQTPGGLHMAPAYDVVSALAFPRADHSLAMGIGGDFDYGALGAVSWANFAASCGLDRRLVERTIRMLAVQITTRMQSVAQAVVEEGASRDAVDGVIDAITPVLIMQAKQATKIRDVSSSAIDAELSGEH